MTGHSLSAFEETDTLYRQKQLPWNYRKESMNVGKHNSMLICGMKFVQEVLARQGNT